MKLSIQTYSMLSCILSLTFFAPSTYASLPPGSMHPSDPNGVNLHSFSMKPNPLPSLQSNHLQKRGIKLKEMEENLQKEADSLHREVISYSPYDDEMNHVPYDPQLDANRDQMTRRTSVLFNRDNEASKSLAKYYLDMARNLKGGIENNYARFNAREHHKFWLKQGSATEGEAPLNEKHKAELIEFIEGKMRYHQSRGDANGFQKWTNQLRAATSNQPEAAKGMQLISHSKIVKALQNKNDWLERVEPAHEHVSLEAFSAPNKKTLLLKMNPWDTSPDRVIRQPFDHLNEDPHPKDISGDSNYLPRQGHAVDEHRIRLKLENSKGPLHKIKWEQRAQAVRQRPGSVLRRLEEIRFRNKEISKRWNHLRWSSIVHQNDFDGHFFERGQSSGSGLLGGSGSGSGGSGGGSSSH